MTEGSGSKQKASAASALALAWKAAEAYAGALEDAARTTSDPYIRPYIMADAMQARRDAARMRGLHGSWSRSEEEPVDRA